MLDLVNDDIKDEIGCMQNLQMAFMVLYCVVSFFIGDYWLQLGKMQLDCIKSFCLFTCLALHSWATTGL